MPEALKISRQAAADAAREWRRHPSYPVIQGWLLRLRTEITEKGKKTGKGEFWYTLDGFDRALSAVEELAAIAPPAEDGAGRDTPGVED